MKKFISLLLVCLMVVPFGMLASTGVSAAGNTVYVSDAGDDTKSGADAANAVKTMQVAYMKLGTAGGTIVISGTFTQDANIKAADAHTGKVTIKGADANAEWKVTKAARFILQGPTEIASIKISCTASFYLLCLFNDITVADSVTMTRTTKTILNMGGQANAPEGGNDYTPKDTTANINGGDWEEVVGMLRNGRSTIDATTIKEEEAFKDVDLTMNVGGTAKLAKVFLWARSGGTTGAFVAENATMTLNLNGGTVTHFMGAHDYKTSVGGFGKGITVNIGENFKIADCFNANTSINADRIASDNVRYSIGGEFLWADSVMALPEGATPLNNSTLVIADAKYNEVIDSGKTYGFKEVKKASEVNTGNQGGNQGGNADTSDVTWVVAVVAAVSVMGCAVVTMKKREN